ncbi:SMI1/KNR4 family protein [Hymenobacter cellulosivorans]|uniref:SMI1/KNR4 family protein n=1 Tax=Hymenobacter cellulosivorans TaxID=2932249 RepID=A0ABY4F6S2_9BACT|nr:SMI1/KNR4 family protein [Hymenobacter cellulosivorans]UOQ51707.1 SMI1/KNR4 family protein [Hymenobacter cellulosivorans]
MSLEDAFRRVENWLEVHAPRILHESLQSGATEPELAELAQALGQPLPADYQDLYRWRNGLDEDADNFGNLFYGLSFTPLAQVLATQQERQASEPVPLVHAQAAVRAENLFNPAWLQLGFDCSHCWLYVDLDPAVAGRYGQVIFVDEENEAAFRVAESVEALLGEFADDLEQGRYQLEPEALDDGNEYLDAAESIDLVNWYRAARWQKVLPPAAY